MKGTLTMLMAASVSLGFGQIAGNAAYGQGGGSPQQNERAKRNLSHDELPPTLTSSFYDASVVINLQADEYVATFAIIQDGSTISECSQKVNDTVAQLLAKIGALGVSSKDVYVDYISQSRTYDYEVKGDIAQEKMTGFEYKKNVSIHYRNKTLFEKLNEAASQVGVYDLVKVDYVVKDLAGIQARLMKEAAQVIRAKATAAEGLLGLPASKPAQLIAQKFAVYFPVQLYESYQAAEAENPTGFYYQQHYAAFNLRKPRTLYFNPLNANDFDRVINPVVLEPTVQCTIYVKVRYDTATAKKS